MIFFRDKSNVIAVLDRDMRSLLNEKTLNIMMKMVLVIGMLMIVVLVTFLYLLIYFCVKMLSVLFFFEP